MGRSHGAHSLSPHPIWPIRGLDGGRKDIWVSKEDALASTAITGQGGLKSDRPWGWEVSLPANFNKP